jgi:zinc protease
MKLKSNINYVRSYNNIFVFYIIIKCGSINEPDDQKGISHFLEHIKFNKYDSHSKHFSHKKANEIGAIMNAYTTYDHTCYFIRCEESFFKTAINILIDVVFSTRFRKSNINLERKIILEEKMMDDNDITNNQFYTVLSSSSPYRDAIIGKSNTLRSITLETLKTYNEKFYNLSNMMFITSYSNKVNKSESLRIINKLVEPYRDNSRNKVNTIDDICRFTKSEYELYVKTIESSSNKCVIKFTNRGLTDPEFIYSRFICYYITTELMNTFRYKYGYVYDIKCTNVSYVYVGVIEISFHTRECNVTEMIKNILLTIRRLSFFSSKANCKRMTLCKKYFIRETRLSLRNIVNLVEFTRDMSYLPYKMTTRLYEKHLCDMNIYKFNSLCRGIFDINKMGCVILTNSKSENTQIDNFITMIRKDIHEYT